MKCAFCKEDGKRFRMVPHPDGKHQAQWCQKCPDPRYMARGKTKTTVTTDKGKDTQ